MLAVLYGVITPESPVAEQTPRRTQERGKRTTVTARSMSTSPGLYSYMSDSKVALERLLFGYHAKTKRSLAEEAESGDETSVFSWIRDGCDVDEFDHYGYTPLLNAATLGRINTVFELLRNGADVNKKGPFGFTALHAAAQVNF